MRQTRGDCKPTDDTREIVNADTRTGPVFAAVSCRSSRSTTPRDSFAMRSDAASWSVEDRPPQLDRIVRSAWGECPEPAHGPPSPPLAQAGITLNLKCLGSG